MILATTVRFHLRGKMTCRHLWKSMLAFLMYGRLRRWTLEALVQRRIRIRLA